MNTQENDRKAYAQAQNGLGVSFAKERNSKKAERIMDKVKLY